MGCAERKMLWLCFVWIDMYNMGRIIAWMALNGNLLVWFPLASRVPRLKGHVTSLGTVDIHSQGEYVTLGTYVCLPELQLRVRIVSVLLSYQVLLRVSPEFPL